MLRAREQATMRRHAAFLDDWEGRRTKKSRRRKVLFGLAVAVLAGFSFGYWAGNEEGRKLARAAAADARQQLAAAVCTERFLRQREAAARLAALMQAGWDERGELVAKGGWATMPDRPEPSAAVAARCAIRLGEAYTSVRKSLPISGQ
jgi:hypothetical protein